MYALIYVEDYEKELYVYNLQEKKKVIRNCSELLDDLLKYNKITKQLKDSLYKIIINAEDVKIHYFNKQLSILNH